MFLNNDEEFTSTLDFLRSSIISSKTKKKKISDKDLKNTDLEAIQKHTEIYTDYLNTYVNEYKKKISSQVVMKWCFFVIIILLLITMIICGVVVICIISKKEFISTADVVTVITAIFGAISSFLILPKVIAENLFPSKEEDKTDQIFEKMFEHDINLRGIYYSSDNDIENSEQQNEIDN